MGECLISRRGGEVYKLPILDADYPQDITTVASQNGNVSFSVSIVEHGKPEVYIYQWYVNGEAVSGAINPNYTIYDLTEQGMITVYCTITNKAGTVTSRAATLNIQDPIPSTYTYSGNSSLIKEDEYNWRIEFYQSGTLYPPRDMEIDVFLVGGGGGGANGGPGGGGGYTQTYRNINVNSNETYDIVIGAGGGSTNNGGNSTAFGYQADGGKSGSNGAHGGSGGGGSIGGEEGKAGNGGSNGSDGGTPSGSWVSAGGKGQGTSTRAFGESSYKLYSGGGGGWGRHYSARGHGGEGGGGNGGAWYYGDDYTVHPTAGATNTGGGGGGGNSEGGSGASGGSGIVIIRNARL